MIPVSHIEGSDKRPSVAQAPRVDGLIVAASLVLLHEARNDRDAPALARFMLWLGISATIGANIAYGAGYGLLGALISAWPAVAFIGAVEIAMQVRRARVPPTSQPCQSYRATWSRRSARPTRPRSRPVRRSASGPWPSGSACLGAGWASSSPASPSRATAICPRRRWREA